MKMSKYEYNSNLAYAMNTIKMVTVKKGNA